MVGHERAFFVGTRVTTDWLHLQLDRGLPGDLAHLTTVEDQDVHREAVRRPLSWVTRTVGAICRTGSAGRAVATAIGGRTGVIGGTLERDAGSRRNV